MVTVDRYIRKLLFEHDCVIIPEFGGLLTHHIGAHYDSVNSAYVPARKRLAFNEVLKIDDGLLNYYVSTNEKLSREEAANQVKGYVDSLRQQLLEEGKVTMDMIGVFSCNTEGKLVFEPDYVQNYNGDWYGFNELNVKEVDRSDWGVEEHAHRNDSEVELIPSHDAYATSSGSRNRQWLNWAAAAIVVAAATLLSALSSTSDKSSLLSTLNPFESVSKIDFASYSTASEPVETLKSTMPAVIVEEPSLEVESETKPIIKEEVVFIPEGETKSKPSPEAVSIESVEIAAPLAAPAVAAVRTKANNNQYHLIAGSFSRLKNAKDLRSQLIRKGFSGCSILESGEGKLIKVSAGAYSSLDNAMQQKNKVDEVTGADSWVYHRR